MAGRRGLGDPKSFSASAAQVRQTSNWINSINNKAEDNDDGINQPKSVSSVGGISNVASSSRPRNAYLSDKHSNETNQSTNGHAPSSPSKPEQMNGNSDQSNNIVDDTNGFPEPKSEPAISRNVFNRQLSSEVLPKPYHAPTGIRSVKRPDTSRLRQGSSGSGGDDPDRDRAASPAAAKRYPMEKSLSKDDIAASLAAADKYLNKIHSSDDSGSVREDEEPPLWRSSLDQMKSKREAGNVYTPEPVHKKKYEEAPEETSTDESPSYDNVADVLSELKASGHAPNTQSNNHSSVYLSNKKPWERDSIVETCVDEPLTPSTPTASVVGGFNSNGYNATVTEPEDTSTHSTSSVYLESKVTRPEEHTYNNIGEFLENKKRRESIASDDEPYEIVAPPTPPSRRAPANLPLAEELNEPEVMSNEEAQNFLSTK